jgi:myb proto-oncogene protein
MSDWANIARLVPGRNDNQCHYKWQSDFKVLPQKDPWTFEEDTILKDLIQKRGEKNWHQIADEINRKLDKKKRSGKQCRERWINFVNPAIKKDAWSIPEDILLLETHQIEGNQWATIAKQIQGRTENQVKNRFNAILKKIREEKTFDSNIKADIQEALLNI